MSHVQSAAHGWHLTHHARQRAHERGLTEADLRLVLDDPDVTYTQSGYGPDRQVRQRGDYAVVINTVTRNVITVVYRSRQRWLQTLAAPGGQPFDGRDRHAC